MTAQTETSRRLDAQTSATAQLTMHELMSVVAALRARVDEVIEMAATEPPPSCYAWTRRANEYAELADRMIALHPQKVVDGWILTLTPTTPDTTS